MKLFLALLFLSAGPALACDDSSKIYKVCANQEEAFNAQVGAAKEQNKMLVLVLGAEWCPWCVSLNGMLKDPAFGGEFAKKFLFGDIAMYDGKVKLESGQAVLHKVQELAKDHDKKKVDGIPILVLVNPRNIKAVIMGTEPLEQNTATHKGHNPKRVLAALEKAAVAVQ